MTTVNKVLLGLLMAQGAMAAVTWRPGPGGPEERVLVAEGAGVTRLEITGRASADEPAGDPLVLSLGDEGWVSASHFDYPVRDGALDGLLDLLDGLAVAAPVAEQPVRHASLNVADDTFTRRVVVTADGEEHTLLLGAAQGSAAYVRVAGEGEVYRVRGLRPSSVPDTAGRLFDRQVVDLTVGAVDSVTLSGPEGERFALRREGDGDDDVAWVGDHLPEGRRVDPEAVEDLLRSVARLRMEEPVAGARAEEHGLHDGVRLAWTTSDGDTSVPGGLTVGAEVDGERFVSLADAPWVVSVRSSAVRDLVEASLDGLLADAEPAADE